MRKAIKTLLILTAFCLGLAWDAPTFRAGAVKSKPILPEPVAIPEPPPLPIIAEVGVGVRAATIDELMPTPPELADRARFWQAVYGEYDSDELIIYHRDYPDLIYGAVTDLPKRKQRAFAKIRARLAILDQLENFSDEPLAEIALEPEAKKLTELYHQFDAVPGPDRFANAAQIGALRTFRGKRDDLRRAYARAAPYLPAMERIFRERGVPVLLTRLVFVESMFERDARSDKGAYGIWQFLDSTAAGRMAMTHTVDGRRDPIASTRAAADLLAENHALLGSWPLAITAFNAGGPRMKIAVRHADSMRLPEVLERYEHDSFGFCVNNYYVQLIGVVKAEYEMRLTAAAFAHGPGLADYDLVFLPRPYEVSTLSRRLGMPLGLLIAYNPAWTSAVERGQAAAPAGYLLRVPKGSERIAREALNVKSVGISATKRGGAYGHNLARTR